MEALAELSRKENKINNIMLKSSTVEEVDGAEPTHKNAAEERLVPKKVHQFYFVKFSPYEDPQLKARIEESANMISKIGPEKLQIYEKIQQRQDAKKHAVWKLESRKYEQRGSIERERMNHLRLALDKLSFANSAYQGRPINLCLSDGEFDKHKLQFRMRHKTNNSAEERHIFREIKSSQRTALKRDEIPKGKLEQLEKRLCHLVTRRSYAYRDEASVKSRLDQEIKELKLAKEIEREKSIAFAAVKGKIWNSLGSKEDLQNQVKLVSSKLDVLRMKQLARHKHFKKELDLEAIQKNIDSLKPKLLDICKRKNEAHQCILKLTTQLSEENARYDQYVLLLANARELAQAKDVEALAELSRKEVENFMTHWNANEAFRDGYKKRVLGSLESRELCRDGRMKNSEEVNVKVKPERPLRRRMKWQSQSTIDSNKLEI